MSLRRGVVLGSEHMSKPGKEERALQRRRIRAGRLLLRGMPQSEVARKGRGEPYDCERMEQPSDVRWTGSATTSTSRSSIGPGATTASRSGAAAQGGALAQGFATELWTLRRVGQLIEEKFSRRYSETQVWRILVSLGFSSQRPTSRALERDEAAIRRWKRVRWPELKKTLENKDESSSSSTSRD